MYRVNMCLTHRRQRSHTLQPPMRSNYVLRLFLSRKDTFCLTLRITPSFVSPKDIIPQQRIYYFFYMVWVACNLASPNEKSICLVFPWCSMELIASGSITSSLVLTLSLQSMTKQRLTRLARSAHTRTSTATHFSQILAFSQPWDATVQQDLKWRAPVTPFFSTLVQNLDQRQADFILF
jgi:hypothetical protein